MTGGFLPGLNVAITTPFDDNGFVDTRLFLAHAMQLINRGVTGIVYTGTTGEGFSVSHSETRDMVQALAELKGQHAGVSIVCGAIKPTRDELFSHLQHGFHESLDAYLIAPPIDEDLSEASVADIYLQAQASGVPVVVYNIPKITGFRFSPSMILDLHDRTEGTVVGVKDSTGDGVMVDAFYGMFKEKGSMPIALFPGNDRKLYYTLSTLSGLRALGRYTHGLGSVSGASSFAPIAELELAIHDAVDNDDHRIGRKIQFYLNDKALKVLELASQYGGEQPIIKAMISAITRAAYPTRVSPGLCMPTRTHMDMITRSAHDIVNATDGFLGYKGHPNFVGDGI